MHAIGPLLFRLYSASVLSLTSSFNQRSHAFDITTLKIFILLVRSAAELSLNIYV